MHLFIYLMYICDCIKIIILIISDSMADIDFYICFLGFFSFSICDMAWFSRILVQSLTPSGVLKLIRSTCSNAVSSLQNLLFIIYWNNRSGNRKKREVIADCVLNNKLGKVGAGGLELLQKTREYLKQRPCPLKHCLKIQTALRASAFSNLHNMSTSITFF